MAKKKIKKFLKNIAPLAALAGGAMLLGKGKGRAFTNANARKLMTSDAAMGKSPYTDAIMRNKFLKNVRMMTPQDMADDMMFQDAMAAKGGRIKKTKKGGRAVRKANRSKKK
jgi:hypothetical protein